MPILDAFKCEVKNFPFFALCKNLEAVLGYYFTEREIFAKTCF